MDHGAGHLGLEAGGDEVGDGGGGGPADDADGLADDGADDGLVLGDLLAGVFDLGDGVLVLGEELAVGLAAMAASVR